MTIQKRWFFDNPLVAGKLASLKYDCRITTKVGRLFGKKGWEYSTLKRGTKVRILEYYGDARYTVEVIGMDARLEIPLQLLEIEGE